MEKNNPNLLWLDSFALTVILSPLIIFLVGTRWPHVLGGTPTFDDTVVHVNYLRNALELTSFLATTLVLVTALVAFFYTKSQLNEARDTRLATVYLAISGKWQSAEFYEYRSAVARLIEAGKANSSGDLAKQKRYYFDELKNARAALHDQRAPLNDQAAIVPPANSKRPVYIAYIAMIYYFEDIGLMARKDYIRKEDIFDLIGTAIKQADQLFREHLEWIRCVEKAENLYSHSLWLMDEVKEYKSPYSRKLEQELCDIISSYSQTKL